jgi:hypothetical protein
MQSGHAIGPCDRAKPRADLTEGLHIEHEPGAVRKVTPKKA